MEEMAKLLSGIFYLATVETTEGGTPQPHVRPFDGAVQIGDKWYFMTTNTKKVYAQLKANPAIEIFALQDQNLIRFTATAVEATGPERDQVVQAIGKYPVGDTTVAVFAMQNGLGTLTVDGQTSPLNF
jgi:uncharacterized pyridoxamine 5'-phosphate oxidase family protein